MPTYMTRPRTADAKSTEPDVEKWRFPFDFDGEQTALEVARLRIEFIRQRDDMLSLQKQYGTQDRELAKFFKEESRNRLRLYRAACLVLPYASATAPGDCPIKDPYEIPPELFSSVELVCRLATTAI